MEVPLLDLKGQYQSIKSEIDEVVQRVIESQYFILSPEVNSLEEEVAEYMGTAHAVGVASGTDALVLALRACGIGEGDEVITTPFTFFATTESISNVGARPVLVDIDLDSYDINPEKIHFIGNSSVMGARIALLSRHAFARTKVIASGMTNIELSTYQPFMDEYVAAMFLPHTNKKLFPSVDY